MKMSKSIKIPYIIFLISTYSNLIVSFGGISDNKIGIYLSQTLSNVSPIIWGILLIISFLMVEIFLFLDSGSHKKYTKIPISAALALIVLFNFYIFFASYTP